ncbi:hypothetical protein [Halegenticoccus soli]|uniref:hypothetical protein n=1 Tax=Halegenticoccus soli TaxID=1985678 RepID=UPI00117B4D31|nr:hypothetical protein [Halegenticoccus soli]
MSDELQDRLRTLRETRPSKYGLLCAYHRDVGRALDECPRNYPCVKQLHGSLENPDVTPQMLGNVLSLFVQLGVLGAYSERSNSNRYDLTEYDRAAMRELAGLLESESETSARG